MPWDRPSAGNPEKRGTRFRCALVLSLLVHGALAVWALTLVAPSIPRPAPEPVQVTLVDRDLNRAPTPSARVAPPGASTTAEKTGATSAAVRPSSAAAVAERTPATGNVVAPQPQPSGTPRRGENGRVVFAPTIEGLVDDHFRREREDFGRNPNDGGPHDPRMLKPGATVTDQLDGIADLGTGEPGDPRIPGAPAIDIGKVLTRDATVVAAREHVAEGQMPQFLCDVKDRIEKEWDPSVADSNVLANPQHVPDPVCDAGYHLRFKVARVLAVYDATGSRVSFRIVGATESRNLHARLSKALDDAGMRPPPADLLDGEGHLRVAWNVFVDSYPGCHLFGNDGRGKKAYGANFTVGIVELDGMY